ncbi:DUF6340 family protein [Flavilitoribacter nigricans]|uniref:Tetratricopeptide repeat protein n=1 Tax=Flavilitoribacter nigricans (strain ATCC 23147 / DSM 23189 / NBRC 102662 / NCIMB 1420 / SS-2) TaxID=1122177 RepID=A0A2D0N8J9_FLAN2|nr:DUF6340 family protein [Flavilitoribacter nigricans]PHN04842.1 hypothetical protein CRP01_20245 [Flavilitoribacter nigricans DSM 23189 = NBRC 102662]
MKNKYSLPLYGLIIGLIWSSCTTTTQIDVLQPAAFSVPGNIERIVTIDRSKPSKGFLNFLEGVVTGEGLGQDKRGRENALRGVTDALTRTPRFEVRSSAVELTGSKSGDRMIEPLPWSEVRMIADQYDVDAVLAIEKYDTDQSSSTRSRQVTRKKDGQEYTETVYDSKIDMRVHIGWRLYDTDRQVIIDEFEVTEGGNDSATGSSEEEALRRLTNQSDMARDISFEAGTLYGMRIAPVWVSVNRQFYTKAKGSDKEPMQRAARYAKANQWESAAEIWRELIEKGRDAKTAGKAAHNMAVASERAGHLDSALDWANKAYLEFGNKSSREYGRQLQWRIEDAKRVEEQMK